MTVLALLGAVAVTGSVFWLLNRSAEEDMKKHGFFDNEVTIPPGKQFGYILIVALSSSYRFDVTPFDGPAVMAVGRVDDGDTDKMSDRDLDEVLRDSVPVEAIKTGTRTGDLTRGRYLWVVANPSKDKSLRVKIKFGSCRAGRGGRSALLDLLPGTLLYCGAMAPPGGGETEIEIVHRDGYTDVRFVGDFSVEGFQRRAAAASQACRDGGTGRMFVDATCYNVGPTTLERYELAKHAVTASAGLTVALLLTPTFLDPDKFGLVVAQNRGLRVEGFTDRQKALDWLLASPPGDARRPTS